MADVVNFGKYRGQPIEILASDRGYCDWLMAQPWFRERYQNLYTVIINHYQQPADTPEHNALQALFLDPDYREAFLALVNPQWRKNIWKWHLRRRDEDIVKRREAVAEAKQKWEEKQSGKGYYPADWYVKNLAEAQAELVKAETRAAADSMTVETWATFEESNIDVKIDARIYTDPGQRNLLDLLSLAIEVKPTVGDDYPSVLRQMNRHGVTVGPVKYLFLEAYTGTGVTQAQFRQIFEASDKVVVFRHEVDAKLAERADAAAD